MYVVARTRDLTAVTDALVIGSAKRALHDYAETRQSELASL